MTNHDMIATADKKYLNKYRTEGFGFGSITLGWH
jgi:hypothetical protein